MKLYETPFFDKLLNMYEDYYCKGWLSDEEEEQYFEFKKIKKIISIELPSDEDIHIGIIEHCKIPHDRLYAEINAMIDGAKWVIDKIKNQQ